MMECVKFNKAAPKYGNLPNKTVECFMKGSSFSLIISLL